LALVEKLLELKSVTFAELLDDVAYRPFLEPGAESLELSFALFVNASLQSERASLCRLQG
jgi:hypothetical protein